MRTLIKVSQLLSLIPVLTKPEDRLNQSAPRGASMKMAARRATPPAVSHSILSAGEGAKSPFRPALDTSLPASPTSGTLRQRVSSVRRRHQLRLAGEWPVLNEITLRLVGQPSISHSEPSN